MKKTILFIFLAFLISCESGNPLDPAKGIDSQGDTTLFSGKVTKAGIPLPATYVICTETYSWSSSETERWRVKTDSNGEYAIRDDLSDLYSSKNIRLAVDGYNSTTKFEIVNSGVVDTEDERQSSFDEVIIKDFIIP